MLEFELNVPMDSALLEALFARAGWRESEAVVKLGWVIAASEEWVTCRMDGELVGFGRSCRFGPARRVLFDVIVDKPYQGQGVDREIIRMLAKSAGSLEEVTVFSERAAFPLSINAPESVGASFKTRRIPLAPAGAYLGRQSADPGGSK
jgi:hypothetical protein